MVYANDADTHEGTVFIVDLKNTPGIFIGKCEETMGFNTLEIADIIFENAKIHKSQILCSEGRNVLYFEINGINETDECGYFLWVLPKGI